MLLHARYMSGAVPFNSFVDLLSSIYEYFLHAHALPQEDLRSSLFPDPSS